VDWILLGPGAGCYVYDNEIFCSVNAGSFSPPTNPPVGFSHGVSAVFSDVVVLALTCEWKNCRLYVLITIVYRPLPFIFLTSCDIIIWLLSSKAAVRWKRFHSFVVWRDAWQWMSGTRLWICLWTSVSRVPYLNCSGLNVIFGSGGWIVPSILFTCVISGVYTLWCSRNTNDKNQK
jgi:hypothetical protein